MNPTPNTYSTPSPIPPNDDVIFFDGYCSLCDSVVSFLLPAAKRGKFKFSSLQGETYRAVLARHPELARIDSAVYIEHFGDAVSEKVSTRANAVSAILARIGGIFLVPLAMFRILPSSWRNALYDWVARNRTKLFPARDTCRLPSPEERALFLP